MQSVEKFTHIHIYEEVPYDTQLELVQKLASAVLMEEMKILARLLVFYCLQVTVEFVL